MTARQNEALRSVGRSTESVSLTSFAPLRRAVSGSPSSRSAGYHRAHGRREGKFCANYEAIVIPDQEPPDEVESGQRYLSADISC